MRNSEGGKALVDHNMSSDFYSEGTQKPNDHSG